MFKHKIFKIMIVVILVIFLFSSLGGSFVTALSPLVPQGQEVEPVQPGQVYTGTIPARQPESSEVSSLSGSFVVFDPSAGGAAQYDPGDSQTFCFRSESFTNDWEYVYYNWLKFPSDWTVSDVSVQGTPSCDNSGTWGTFLWDFEGSTNEVRIDHPRYHTSNDHCVATYCIVVTPGVSGDPAPVSWFFSGDSYGSTPHWPCSSDGYAPPGYYCDETVLPPAYVPKGSAPFVFISPAIVNEKGCKGEPQTHSFKLTNGTGSTSTFNLTYDTKFVTGILSGPAQITLPNGATADFDVTIDSHSCLSDSVLRGTIQATSGCFSHSAMINKDVYAELKDWEEIRSSPIKRMDNVLAAYDEKVWDIIGFGESDSVTWFDPETEDWTIVADSAPPFGSNYARSGCQIGSKVFVYGDASNPAFTGLWSYNMATNTWSSVITAGTAPPHEGIWAPAWVADPSSGKCYLTGGATAPGNGNLTSVYVYNANSNSWETPLPDFSSERDFHAAFLFDRPSDGHQLLCVAGGVGSTEHDTTQCYDFDAGHWNSENADLGLLPHISWGMGYTHLQHGDKDQLWIINGVLAGSFHGKNSYYDLVKGIWVDAGPLESGRFYRTAAVALGDRVYHVGGSTGGFTISNLADHYLQIDCPTTCQPPKGEWFNVGLGNGCPDWTRYDAEYSQETGLAYLLGGRSGAISEGDIYAFDPSTGTCLDTDVDMIVPVSNYSIARLAFSDGERLCTFGGYDITTGLNIRKVQCYSPTLNNVVTKADLPIVFDGFMPGGVEVINNKAYIFGGYSNLDPPYNLAVTYEYNPLTNSYLPRGNMALPRGYMITAVLDGTIYAFGGHTFDGSSLFSESIAERFDPASGTWDAAAVPNLPVASAEGRAFGFDTNSGFGLAGKIVLAGGGQWPDETAEALVYDTPSQTYDYDFGDLNISRRNHAAFFEPGDLARMWVLGGRSTMIGYGGDGQPFARHEFYSVHHRPVAEDQSITIPEGESIVVDLAATDADGDPLIYIIVDGPEHGMLSGSGASRTYTPDAGYNGADGFTFKANDGEFDSNIATVSIAITRVNHPPVAEDQSIIAHINSSIVIDLVATDPDGDPLTFTIVNGPSHGTLSGSGVSRTYTPDAGYHGLDSFTFKANDGEFDSNIATVNISVIPGTKIYLPLVLR